jgi:hypothetical protein
LARTASKAELPSQNRPRRACPDSGLIKHCASTEVAGIDPAVGRGARFRASMPIVPVCPGWTEMPERCAALMIDTVWAALSVTQVRWSARERAAQPSLKRAAVQPKVDLHREPGVLDRAPVGKQRWSGTSASCCRSRSSRHGSYRHSSTGQRRPASPSRRLLARCPGPGPSRSGALGCTVIDGPGPAPAAAPGFCTRLLP